VTLHLASSKSGSTIETRSHLEWAWERAGGRGRFAVITDPGSELAALARERDFADVFENRADIGGRYSALSLFGIVPGLLMGADVGALLRGGLDALAQSAPDVSPDENPALLLATAISAGVRVGRDKVTYLLDPALTAMGLWVEQLVAESLGKDGTGAVPIVSEPLGAPGVYGGDRLFLSQLPIPELEAAGHPTIVGGTDSSPHGIGHMAVTMELAIALTGAAIDVQPFDQPDVAAAKAATSEVLAEGGVEVPEQPLEDLLDLLEPGDHLALQAFVDPGDPRVAELEAARVALRDRHRVATSLGLGPRFLHSTGQLHKGGPRAIVCVQVASEDATEVPIPGRTPRLPATCGRSKPAASEPVVSRCPTSCAPGGRHEARDGGSRPHGREHGGAPPIGWSRGRRLRRVQRRHRRRVARRPRGGAAGATSGLGDGPRRGSHRGHGEQPGWAPRAGRCRGRRRQLELA
jgi:hypothetical protein